MSEHLTHETLRRWRSGDGLSAETVIAVAAHLSSCRDCATLARADVRIDGAASAIREQLAADAHPDHETELTPFAEGIADRDVSLRVETHLATCAQCREDVDDLRDLAKVSPARWRHLVVAVAAVAAIAFVALILLRQRSATIESSLPLERPRIRVTSPPATPSPSEWSTLIRDARAGVLPAMPPVLGELRSGADILRGEGSSLADIAPAGVVVESTRPRFVWPSERGDRATIVIYDGTREVLRSKPGTRAPWIPATDLPRGVTYTWEVEIEQDGALRILPAPPAPPARFHVIAMNLADDLERARSTRDPLLIGLVAARIGLVAEAREALQKVTAPADVDAARNALRRLDSWSR